MRDIEACRTAVLGGHMAQCDRCGAQVVRYHSCRNRHCPKCQTLAKVQWVEARQQDLLPVPYFHGVFTLPHGLNALAQSNPRPLYGLLCQSASETLQTFGRDPAWLGGELGLTLVLHTWNQVLEHHIHVHCVVTGGALAPAGDRWMTPHRRDFLFPVKALSRVFRSKYLEALAHTHHRGNSSSLTPSNASVPLRALHASCRALRARLGRLCQSSLWLGPPCPELPRPVYPPRRHQQRPPRGTPQWPDLLPVAQRAPGKRP